MVFFSTYHVDLQNNIFRITNLVLSLESNELLHMQVPCTTWFTPTELFVFAIVSSCRCGCSAKSSTSLVHLARVWLKREAPVYNFLFLFPVYMLYPQTMSKSSFGGKSHTQYTTQS